MASRTWLAVAIGCFIWFGYLRWFAPQPTPNTAKPIQETTTQESTKAANPSGSLNTGLTESTFEKTAALNTVKNAQMEVDFSSQGGKISEVRLLKYGATIKKEAERIRPVSPDHSLSTLATLFTDKNLTGLANGFYDVSVQGNQVTAKRTDKAGTLKKTYRVSEDGYQIDAEYELTLQGDFAKTAQNGLGYLLVPVGTKTLEYDYNEPLKAWELVAQQNDSVKREPLEKLKEEDVVHQGNTSWLAFGNRYFATVLINQSEINPDVVYTKRPDFIGGYLRYPVVVKNGQNTFTLKLKIFSGPKDYAELNKIPGLRSLIDYGTFSFFAYPLLEILRFFYRFVHNYGVAIILLTVLVRLLFYPLSAKSFRSMKEMQKLQPQIALLKEKYKDDMQRQQQEQMALFKAHKVNPMGGCFPMLVQLPVFIALYAVLGNSIELFHAPFFGWIRDLSTKDPFYIYPILMGISMFIQQKMTPSAGMDPAQQKMMLFMPIIFTVMMVSLPSGLTLYIFVSTILGVLQQLSLKDGSSKQAKLVVAGTSGSGNQK